MILLSPHLVNSSVSPVQVLACSLNQSPLLQSVYFSDSHIISTHIEEERERKTFPLPPPPQIPIPPNLWSSHELSCQNKFIPKCFWWSLIPLIDYYATLDIGRNKTKTLRNLLLPTISPALNWLVPNPIVIGNIHKRSGFFCFPLR